MDDMNEGILRVTNHQDHPTNPHYKVFFFYKKEEADFFENLLKERNIWYEKDEEFTRGKTMYLFGIKKTNVREVDKLNFLTIGTFRKPIFENKYLRYGVVAFGIFLVILGVVSYFMSPVFQNG